MYQQFFSLKDLPFSLSPDPDFLFLSDRHKEAIAHLRYGLQSNGGFVLLTGEVGTGKTTVCRLLLQEIPEQLDVAFILNPALNEVELLATICDEYKISYPRNKVTLKTLFDSLATWMTNNHHQGRRAVVLIDEAQHLSFSVLEQLRLLTNIESNNKNTLQVILIGQTELREKLKSPTLRQLAQRITARYHLLTLTEKETGYYVQHRLNVAGAAYPIFEPGVVKKIFKHSRGVPRLINLICDRCLLCAYGIGLPKVSQKVLKTVVKEVDLDYLVKSEPSNLKYWARFALLTVLILLLGMQLPKLSHSPLISLVAEKARVMTVSFDANMQENVLPTQSAPVGKPIDIKLATNISDNLETGKVTEQTKTPVWFEEYPQLDLTSGEFAYALRSLYAVWGYQVDLAEISCEQGNIVSLVCFSEKSSIEKLQQLNYPAVIKLNNGDDYLYAVVYKILDSYHLIIGEQGISVSQAWLQKYWGGGLTLLWQAPFMPVEKINFGESSDRVAWLNDQLNSIYSRPVTSKRNFDNELQEQVKLFQRDNQLIDDGVAGMRTLMLIMQRTHPHFPRLI